MIHAEAFTAWFYSDGPYSICNMSMSLSLVCQALFIHLWHRLFSNEECWRVGKLHWCTLLLCIPEETEKDRRQNRGREKKWTPHFYHHIHHNAFSLTLNATHFVHEKLKKGRKIVELPQHVVLYSVKLQPNIKVSFGLDKNWPSHGISTGHFPVLLFKQHFLSDLS